MSLIRTKKTRIAVERQIRFTCNRGCMKEINTWIGANTQTRISLCCAATFLNVSVSSVREKRAGTENLVHIELGSHGKRKSVLLEQVVNLHEAQNETAINAQSKINSKFQTALSR